jgi:hypothetical protein
MAKQDETVTEAMIEAGCAALHKMSDDMLARERSKTPEDMPDYDEGDLCRAIYTAMQAADQERVDDDAEWFRNKWIGDNEEMWTDLQKLIARLQAPETGEK